MAVFLVADLGSIPVNKAQIEYRRRPGSYGGKPSVLVNRQFDVQAPDTAWGTDITYIKTMEGFANLAVVIDLFSRCVIGWSLQACRPPRSSFRPCTWRSGAASHRTRC